MYQLKTQDLLILLVVSLFVGILIGSIFGIIANAQEIKKLDTNKIKILDDKRIEQNKIKREKFLEDLNKIQKDDKQKIKIVDDSKSIDNTITE